MDNWTIAFSPGGFRCQATWNTRKGDVVCDDEIPAGYVIARHPDYPDQWMCLRCMVATTREYLRENRIEILAGKEPDHVV